MKQQKTKRGRTERGVKKMRSAAGCKVNLQTKHSNRVSGPGCPKNRVGFEFESRGWELESGIWASGRQPQRRRLRHNKCEHNSDSPNA